MNLVTHNDAHPRQPAVLFVCHYLHHVVGGAEIIGHRVVQFLRQAGWRVEVVALPGPRMAAADASHAWTLPLGMEPESLLAKQLAVYAGALGMDRRAARSILPRLAGRTFDLVVAHDTVSAGTAAHFARVLGLPWACFVYEPLPRAMPNVPGAKGWMGGLLARHANCALRRLLPTAAVRIAASADTGRRLDAFAPGATTVVAYNSVEVPTVPPGPGEGLLFVGRLSAEKGFDLLCDAYEGLAAPPPLSLAALDGPLAARAMDLARRKPGVQMLPRIKPEDMPETYARHAVVIAPSAWPDPLPGAVLEARALQRALLVSNRGGIPEIVQGYGPLRMFSMDEDREAIVRSLRRGLEEAPAWSRIAPDPRQEGLFRERHAPGAHASSIVEALSSAMATPGPVRPGTPP